LPSLAVFLESLLCLVATRRNPLHRLHRRRRPPRLNRPHPSPRLRM
jgi:hypothetical protein